MSEDEEMRIRVSLIAVQKIIDTIKEHPEITYEEADRMLLRAIEALDKMIGDKKGD